MEAAKLIHKEAPSSESLALLIDVYFARVDEFVAKEAYGDASALLDVIGERFSGSSLGAVVERIEQARKRLQSAQAGLDGVLARLADPTLPRLERAELERVLVEELDDPSRVAACEGLPVDHPLRVEARLISQAFTAVCSGPVDDEVILLAEIPRRSPFAPWKLLIRAIASTYRGEPEKVREHLARIPEGAAVRRLVPVFETLLAPASLRSGLVPSGARNPSDQLCQGILPHDDTLRQALRSVDKAFARFRSTEGFSEFSAFESAQRKLRRLCAEHYPALLERVEQQLYALLIDDGASPSLIWREFELRPTMNCRVWRLLADVFRNFPSVACTMWEEYLSQGVHEGLWGPAGVEVAAVSRRMVESLRLSPPISLRTLRFDRNEPFYNGQSKSVLAGRVDWTSRMEVLDIHWLYERICRCEPNGQNFQAWHTWRLAGAGAKQRKSADEIAQRWHAALPQEPRPLLLLVESAEARGALKKAFGFLEQAEALDGLNASVREARLRLLVKTALGHIRNPKLLLKDLDMLLALANQSGEGAALCAALEEVSLIVSPDSKNTPRATVSVGKRGGSPSAAPGSERNPLPAPQDPVASGMLAWVVATWAEVSDLDRGKLKVPAQASAKKLALAAAQVGAVAQLIDRPIMGIERWAAAIASHLYRGGTGLSELDLLRLANACAERHPEVGFAATAAGLRRPGNHHEVAFLLGRAKCIGPRANRINDLCCAATVLGRQRGQVERIDDAVNLWRRVCEWSPRLVSPERLDARLPHLQALAEAVLSNEKTAKDYEGYFATFVGRPPVFSQYSVHGDEWARSGYDDDIDRYDEWDEDEEFGGEFGDIPCQCPKCGGKTQSRKLPPKVQSWIPFDEE